jgi:hypothetical protein
VWSARHGTYFLARAGLRDPLAAAPNVRRDEVRRTPRPGENVRSKHRATLSSRLRSKRSY